MSVKFVKSDSVLFSPLASEVFCSEAGSPARSQGRSPNSSSWYSNLTEWPWSWGLPLSESDRQPSAGPVTAARKPVWQKQLLCGPAVSRRVERGPGGGEETALCRWHGRFKGGSVSPRWLPSPGGLEERVWGRLIVTVTSLSAHRASSQAS